MKALMKNYNYANAQIVCENQIDDLNEFVSELKSKGVEVLDVIDEGYGKFAWILDPNGIKIELWQQTESE